MTNSPYFNACARIEHLEAQLECARQAGSRREAADLQSRIDAEKSVAFHALRVLQSRRERQQAEQSTEITIDMVQGEPLPGGDSPLVLAARAAMATAQTDLEELKRQERRHRAPDISDEHAMENMRQRRAYFYERKFALEEAIRDARIDLFMAPVRDAEEAFFQAAASMAEAFYGACLAARSVQRRLGLKATRHLTTAIYTADLPRTLPAFSDFATDSSAFRRWSQFVEKRRGVMRTDGADKELRK